MLGFLLIIRFIYLSLVKFSGVTMISCEEGDTQKYHEIQAKTVTKIICCIFFTGQATTWR